VQELSAAFIPTADQIEGTARRGCLEDGTDLESRLVQKIKKQCNNLASYQGVFVATPEGEPRPYTRNSRRLEPHSHSGGRSGR
jgi:hypothetical protein